MNRLMLLALALSTAATTRCVYGDEAPSQQRFVIQTRITSPSKIEPEDSILKGQEIAVVKDQDATCRQTVRRSFVVAVDTIRGSLGVANQPVIREVATGLTATIRVSHVDGDWVTLDVVVEESRISRVDEQKLDDTTTVQVPVVTMSTTQVIKTVRLGKCVAVELQGDGRRDPHSELQFVVRKDGDGFSGWDSEAPMPATAYQRIARLAEVFTAR